MGKKLLRISEFGPSPKLLGGAIIFLRPEFSDSPLFLRTVQNQDFSGVECLYLSVRPRRLLLCAYLTPVFVYFCLSLPSKPSQNGCLLATIVERRVRARVFVCLESTD